MSEWRECKIKEFASINMGQSPKSEYYNNEGIGLPFLQGNRTFGIRYPSIDTYCSEPKKIANSSEILFSVRAPVGDINIANQKICIGRGLASLNAFNGENIFLFYLLHYLKQEILNSEGGTVFGSINRADLEDIKVNLPPPSEQRAIASMLSSLDDKIDLLHRQNKTLEDMAETLFRQWFVEFEFPDENGNPYKSSGGEMVDSELGEIPKGWECNKLDTIIQICSGKRPNAKSDICTNDYYFPIVGASKTMGYTNEYLYNEPVLIIGRVGTHGVVQRYDSKVYPSDNTLVIKSRYYYYAYTILSKIDYNSMNVGSTQPLITQTNIKSQDMIIPNEEILINFESTISIFYELIKKNENQNRILSEIRDTLLPKLMSGEIRVPIEEELKA